MKERTYLNEEKYQKSKKRLVTIAVVIMLIGVLISGTLLAIAISRTSNAIQVNRANIANKEALGIHLAELELQFSDVSAKTKDDLTAQLEALELQYDHVKQQSTDEFHAARGFSERYNALAGEQRKLWGEMTDIETAMFHLENSLGDLTLDAPHDAIVSEYNMRHAEISGVKSELDKLNYAIRTHSVASSKTIPFFMFGAFILLTSLIIGGYLLMIANGRNISAFAAQATVPVGKEVIEEMTPTMASSRGQVAEEVTKGVMRGLSDENSGAGTSVENIITNLAAQRQSPAPGRAQQSCPRCGAVAGTDSAFCDQCGKKL